mmetsp:Transcript_36577/g.48015  ORF Transcript_36577/g.48015 Transcript_36577/m.48015 type:complete len:218 (+) Transcript_36577:2106-2759(+)
MNLSWLHAKYKGYESPGCRELIVALADAPNESLYSTELVISLADLFWNYYYKKILLRCFIPYAIYFISTLIYMTNYAYDGISEDERWAFSFEFLLRFLVAIGTIYFFYFELVAFVRDGLVYFFDVFNYFDLCLPWLNLYLLYNTTHVTPGEDRQTIRALAAFSTTLMWCKAFYWLRLFSSTSFYIRLIIETLWDIRYFLILFVFVLMTFGNALIIMD